jgi:hypothetical protein
MSRPMALRRDAYAPLLPAGGQGVRGIEILCVHAGSRGEVIEIVGLNVFRPNGTRHAGLTAPSDRGVGRLQGPGRRTLPSAAAVQVLLGVRTIDLRLQGIAAQAQGFLDPDVLNVARGGERGEVGLHAIDHLDQLDRQAARHLDGVVRRSRPKSQ